MSGYGGRWLGAKLVAVFAAIHLLWGSNFLAIRYGAEAMPPLLGLGFGLLGLAPLVRPGGAAPQPGLAALLPSVRLGRRLDPLAPPPDAGRPGRSAARAWTPGPSWRRS